MLDVLQTDFNDTGTEVKSADDDQHFTNLSMGSKCEKFIEDHKLSYHTADSVPTSVCETFVADMHVSEQDIQYIESHTVGQSINSYWHTVRKEMITASNFKKVCECVSHNRNPPSLVKKLF